MAEALARNLPDASITLAVPRSGYQQGATPDGYRLATYTRRTFLQLILDHDVIICTQFTPLALLPFFRKWYVLDSFTPYLIEWLENTRDGGMRERQRAAWIGMSRRYINTQIVFGDVLLCANERQRDYFTGMMMNLGLITRRVYRQDASLGRIVRLAPHGVKQGLPGHNKSVIRGVYPGVGGDDKLIVWNGGILQWYDPITLVRAMAIICQKRSDVKLVFVGGAYPGLGAMGLGKRHEETVELARELGLLNKHVFFERNWIPYDEMQNYMSEADFSVCTYFDNIETHFSLRTRFIDLFWAELPLICTHGDVFAEMVERRGFGIVVPEGDIDAVAAGIERFLDDHDFFQSCKRNLAAAKASLAWDVAMRPLIEYSTSPNTGGLPKLPRLPAGVWSWLGYGAARALFAIRNRLGWRR
jgi:glycosyltransferase involved in cell wall biosynthesis